MSITIDITPDVEDGGFLYALYIERQPGELTLIGSGHEHTLEGVFQNLQSLTERTI